MDLNKLVNNAMTEIQESGFVEATVKKQLEGTISSIVSDLFRSYSPFGKELEKQIGEQLNIDFKNLDISTYNTLVLNAVKEKLNHAMHIQGVESIQESMDALLGDPIKEIKLSELVEKMKNSITEWDDDHDEQITLDIDADREILCFIGLDPEQSKSRYQCKYRMIVRKDGSIHSIEINDQSFDNKVIMGGLRGFDEVLLKLYVSGSKIIIDEDNVETYYSDNY